MTDNYQPRFVAYAKHLGKRPEDVAPGFGADFMCWISAKWGEWAKATGRSRHVHTQSDHDDFDAFLCATGSAS